MDSCSLCAVVIYCFGFGLVAKEHIIFVHIDTVGRLWWILFLLASACTTFDLWQRGVPFAFVERRGMPFWYIVWFFHSMFAKLIRWDLLGLVYGVFCYGIILFVLIHFLVTLCLVCIVLSFKNLHFVAEACPCLYKVMLHGIVVIGGSGGSFHLA